MGRNLLDVPVVKGGDFEARLRAYRVQRFRICDFGGLGLILFVLCLQRVQGLWASVLNGFKGLGIRVQVSPGRCLSFKRVCRVPCRV